MFDTIILLTGPVEGPVLSSLLRSHNPQLTVHAVQSLAELEAIEPQALRRSRLVAFVTSVVVPARILGALGFGAYNFHPGPPHYPRWVPSHFAIYDGASVFGATAHVMAEAVDAGPIVGVELFPIPPNTSVLSLEAMAFSQLARLFWRLAKNLAIQSEPLPELPISWSGRKSTRRLYTALCHVPPDILKEELDRRIAVLGDGHFGLWPTIVLHGHRFRYAPREAEPNVEAPGIVPVETKVMEPA